MAFKGDGPEVTNLNADNLASGTVGTARLGSGTASSSTFLRGDQSWQSISAGGDYILRTYTSPATWTKPANLKAIQITLVAGGGGGGGVTATHTPGDFKLGTAGGNGLNNAIAWLPVSSIPGPVSVTVGAGGTAGPTAGGNGGSGGTSSFGPFLSATGGNGGNGRTTSGQALQAAPGGVATGPALVAVKYNTARDSGWGIDGFTRELGTPKNARGYGSGGGAGVSNGNNPAIVPADAGGIGAGGIIIIEEFY